MSVCTNETNSATIAVNSHSLKQCIQQTHKHIFSYVRIRTLTRTHARACLTYILRNYVFFFQFYSMYTCIHICIAIVNSVCVSHLANTMERDNRIMLQSEKQVCEFKMNAHIFDDESLFDIP